jgi:hypothetical protein
VAMNKLFALAAYRPDQVGVLPRWTFTVSARKLAAAWLVSAARSSLVP